MRADSPDRDLCQSGVHELIQKNLEKQRRCRKQSAVSELDILSVQITEPTKNTVVSISHHRSAGALEHGCVIEILHSVEDRPVSEHQSEQWHLRVLCAREANEVEGHEDEEDACGRRALKSLNATCNTG